MENPDNVVVNKPERDALGRLLPGNTANPNGRPKGKTLKEYQAEKFRVMSDEEKEEWLKDVAKGERWRMSEGNPAQSTDLTSKGERLIVIPAELINKNDSNPITEPDSEGHSSV